jgi:cyclic pyranopterin phosphate synthase
MKDKYNRSITYLRISVTDRCNLRCRYCMPEEGVQMLSHNQILTFEEILEVAKTAVSLGVTKIRVTGEPLVRKGIVNLIQLLSQIEGLQDLSMTTNGILLKEFALSLKQAGLQRVNISLDTLDPVKFSHLTRGGNLSDVLEGIDAAIDAGLTPIKINCVINESADTPDALSVSEFADSKGIQVRYIKQMNLKTGSFSVVQGGSGGKCSACNRLRLTANGKIKPCLFNDLEYDVRELGAVEAINRAVTNKPSKGSHNHSGQFYNIGG